MDKGNWHQIEENSWFWRGGIVDGIDRRRWGWIDFLRWSLVGWSILYLLYNNNYISVEMWTTVDFLQNLDYYKKLEYLIFLSYNNCLFNTFNYQFKIYI